MRLSGEVKKISLAGLFVAIGIILPVVLGSVAPEVGSVISPMHIPVLLCGYICGKKYGAVVGVSLPFIKIMVYGVPPLHVVIPMAIELAGYGFFAGYFNEKMGDSIKGIYKSLTCSMVIGRILYGVAKYIVYSYGLFGFAGGKYTLLMFLMSGAVLGGIPAIISHLIVIPCILQAVKKRKG